MEVRPVMNMCTKFQVPNAKCRVKLLIASTTLYLEMGASTIENDISTIDSRWFGIKNRNGGGVSTIGNSWSTIGAQLNQPDLTLKFGMGRGGPRITLYMWVLYIRITFYSSVRYLRITTSFFSCTEVYEIFI